MSKYIYGRNAVFHAIKSGDVKKLFIAEDSQGLKLDPKDTRGFETVTVGRKKLDEMVRTFKHQGIVAEVEQYQFAQLNDLLAFKKEFPLVVILDEISDPQNYGAIIRSCDEFGVDFIVVKNKNQSPINATVRKASAGALSYVKIIEVTNLNNTIEILKKHKFWIIGLAGEADGDIYHFDYKIPVALVFGSEGSGIAPLTRKNCDALLSIPTVGHVGSLNVSVSVGVTLANLKRLQNS